METINYFINSAYTNFINSPCVNKLENGTDFAEKTLVKINLFEQSIRSEEPKKVYLTLFKEIFRISRSNESY